MENSNSSRLCAVRPACDDWPPLPPCRWRARILVSGNVICVRWPANLGTRPFDPTAISTRRTSSSRRCAARGASHTRAANTTLRMRAACASCMRELHARAACASCMRELHARAACASCMRELHARAVCALLRASCMRAVAREQPTRVIERLLRCRTRSPK